MVFTKIARILSNAVLAAVIVIAALMLVPRILGYMPYTVLSGSMEPAYPVGGIVFVQPTAPENLHAGDVVMYQLANGVPVTHRVVSADSTQRTFITKGDANPTEDPSPVPFDAVIGKAKLYLPLLGYIALFVQTVPGLICVVLMMLIVLLLPKAVGLIEEPIRNQTTKAPGKPNIG